MAITLLESTQKISQDRLKKFPDRPKFGKRAFAKAGLHRCFPLYWRCVQKHQMHCIPVSSTYRTVSSNGQ